MEEADPVADAHVAGTPEASAMAAISWARRVFPTPAAPTRTMAKGSLPSMVARMRSSSRSRPARGQLEAMAHRTDAGSARQTQFEWTGTHDGPRRRPHYSDHR